MPLPVPKPDAESLRRLYGDQRLTTREIAARLGVSKGTVQNCLRAYGIPTRPNNRGLENQGIDPPTREELERWVHGEHQTYEEIGNRYGVTRGAVMHWLKRHGIRRPLYWETVKKGYIPPPLDEATLRRLYEKGLSTTRIGTIYGRSDYLVAKLCRKYGIPLRPEGWAWGGDRLPGADGHEVRSAYELQVCDWLTSHAVPHVYEPVLPNPVFRSDFLANGWYIEVWGVENDPVYDDRRRRKEAIYKAHNLPLISIEGRNFRRMSTVEKRLLACLEPVVTPLGF